MVNYMAKNDERMDQWEAQVGEVHDLTTQLRMNPLLTHSEQSLENTMRDFQNHVQQTVGHMIGESERSVDAQKVEFGKLLDAKMKQVSDFWKKGCNNKRGHVWMFWNAKHKHA